MSEITIKKSMASLLLLIAVVVSSFITYVVATKKAVDCPVTSAPSDQKRSVLDGQNLQNINTRDGKRF